MIGDSYAQNRKVLKEYYADVQDLAIREAVNKLVNAVDSGAWKPQNQ